MNDIARISRDKKVIEAVNGFEKNLDRALDLAIQIQQIPAPTFHEEQRAVFVKGKFEELGLLNVRIDEVGNVYGRISGTRAEAPPIILTAHTDTVFSETTDLTVSKDNGKGEGILSGPGLADNSMGVAGLLVLIESLINLNIQPVTDVWFVANVAEEGLGDLNGMRRVVDHFGKAGAYIIVEGGSYGHIFHGAIGVRRFRVKVTTEGGHSWGNFGSPNAIHIIGRFIAAVTEIEVPKKPKTTFNVGLVEGGTTINSIASEASLLLDLRSAGPDALSNLVGAVEKIAADLGEAPGVTITLEQIGNRPAGEVAVDSPLIVQATQALRQVGCNDYSLLSGSTDANIPISAGYPAVCIGLANAGNTHRTDEYLDSTNLPNGLSQLLLLTLAAAGYQTE